MGFTQITFRLKDETAGRLRAAVDNLRGMPLELTLDGVAEESLAKAVSTLEKKHNGGTAFEPSRKKAQRR